MSRSALGRGLGSLLADHAGQGVPIPGPGVGRLLKGETRSEATVSEATPRPLAVADKVEVSDTTRDWTPSVELRWCFGAADLSLVLLAIWLGGFSRLAGTALGILASMVMLTVGSFLGVMAVFRRSR